MSNEKLTKKLALFYHPLFQNTVIEWILSFHVDQTVMDIMTFIEINLRIQKVIIPEFEFTNSLSSAVTDWVRELESLSTKKENSHHVSDKHKSSKEITRNITEMIQGIPFDLIASGDTYISFFRHHREQLPSHYLMDKLSFSAFAKFLFDLCYSWCEYLDIELFTLFLIGLLYQVTTFQTANLLTVRPFNQIKGFTESFIAQIKRHKTHYNRYKEAELSSYESWYEWNYMPSRLREIKKRVIESLMKISKDDTLPPNSIVSHLGELYDASISQLVLGDLDKPTTSHFEYILKDKKPKYNQDLSYSVESNFSPSMMPSKVQYEREMKFNTYKKVHKKLAIPIFGKAVAQNQQEEMVRVHTIARADVFREGADEFLEGNNISMQNDNHLAPIWEREVSEDGSVTTDAENNENKAEEETFDARSQGESEVSNQPIPVVDPKTQFRKKKELRSQFSDSTNTQFLRDPKLLLEHNNAMVDMFRNPFLMEENVSDGQKFVENRLAPREPLEEEEGEDEIELKERLQNKFHLLLSTQEEKKRRQFRKLTPQKRAPYSVLTNANLFNEILAEVKDDDRQQSNRGSFHNNLSFEIKRVNRGENPDVTPSHVPEVNLVNLIIDKNLLPKINEKNQRSSRPEPRRLPPLRRKERLSAENQHESNKFNSLEITSKAWEKSRIEKEVNLDFISNQQEIEQLAKTGMTATTAVIKVEDKKINHRNSKSVTHKRHVSVKPEVPKVAREWPRNNSIKIGEVFDRMLKVGEENRRKQGMRMKNFAKKSEEKESSAKLLPKLPETQENSTIKKMLLNEAVENFFKEL